MAFTKYLSIKKSVLFMILGLTVFAIYLYFFIGIPQIMVVLNGINSSRYVFFYSLALIAVLSSVFFWSAAWNSVLKSLSVNVSNQRAYLYYWVGYFTDLVVPCATVCGEVTRLYLVQKETQENYGALAAAAVTNRVVAYTIVTIGLYVGAALILFKPGVPPILSNIFMIFLIGVTIYYATLLYLAVDKRAARNLTKLYLILLKTFRPKHYRLSNIEETQNSLSDFYIGFQTFREKPKTLIKPAIFHLTSYILGLLVYVLVFYAVGIPSITPEFYIVVFFIATAVQDVSASFSVGSLDILLATIFVLYGISPAISGITALLLRSASFWFPLFVGFVCVQFLGARNILAAKPEDPKIRAQRTRKKIEETEKSEKMLN